MSNVPLNEKIDIWSLGNNMYSILTGMDPFYDDMGDFEITQVRTIPGKTAVVFTHTRDMR